MKKLLYTTTAFVLCGSIVQANAACIATPSCTAMGYTSSSSCTNGIKCPFGNYWNCDLSNKITELTNKITEIEQKVEDLETPKEVCYIGSILYSDKSCSVTVIAGKTPIGIVVYIDGTGGGQALALKSIGSYEWGGYGTDISGLTNYNSESAASKDYDSCGNTAKIIAAGDKSKYPAVWAANEYSTEGTSAGDWCLPAAGIFTSVYNNQTAINLGFEKVGGTTFTTSTYAWSSSELNHGIAWNSNFSDSYGLDGYGNGGKVASYEVRPVLEFPIEEKTACDSSYQYTCTGANESPSGEACDGKYQSCSCSSGYKWDNGACINPCSSPYVWDGSSCVCASYYKYSCNGSYQTGGSGVSCNGKYASCNCSYPYEWSSTQCKTTAVNTCTGEHETGGIGTAYNGKYISCSCETNYHWCGYGTREGFCVGPGENCF